MPTILSHPAVPFALGLGLGTKIIPRPLLAAGMVASILPDLDVIAFRIGVPYASQFGHRGFSHSLLFAFAVALLGAGALLALRIRFNRAFWFLFLATASHGILDACTNGGLGIAFLWPWSNERFFLPYRVIEVSPLSMSRFLSHRGHNVILSELLWVWAPCLLIGATMMLVRWKIAKPSA
ncbi:MAG: metal-dependent hydrolase [Gammaproteobacteria bacterium]|nr:metal-dependent hydrolase [Gammaproteobacteria bacterium]